MTNGFVFAYFVLRHHLGPVTTNHKCAVNGSLENILKTFLRAESKKGQDTAYACVNVFSCFLSL